MTRDERGSVLVLVPAAVLIVVLLGAIAVDAAVAFLGEREAAGLAAGAANDAATAALDEAELRRTGEFRLHPDRARRRALEAVRASSSALDEVAVDVVVTTIGGEPAVTVTVRGTARYVFAPAIPGAPDSIQVEASATAVARVG